MDRLIARYRFDDESRPGADASGHGWDARALGSSAPHIAEIAGRRAAVFAGGSGGTSYFELPAEIFRGISDGGGITVTAWVNPGHSRSPWERIFDFGRSEHGPYLFLTRNLRGVCYCDGDIAADPLSTCAPGEWVHIAMTVSGTKGGTLSSAGPVIYENGEPAADGQISQTASGTYKKLREWFASFENGENYVRNYIGRSQFAVDADFAGAISDFRIYADALEADEILDIMCESLAEGEILAPAAKRLNVHHHILMEPLALPDSLLRGRVSVSWESDSPEVLRLEAASSFKPSGAGEAVPCISETAGLFAVPCRVNTPSAAILTARLTHGSAHTEKQFSFTVLPEETAPYTLTIHADQPVLDISETLYGLFYEDINNAADGGLYAELVRNRSFEAFTFDTYDSRSGENGRSTGRNRTPLDGWYGDTDKLTVRRDGGLAGLFSRADEDGNTTYVTAAPGAVITNRGFSDASGNFAMHFVRGEKYDFTVWAKSETETAFSVRLLDAQGKPASNSLRVSVSGGWKKYGCEEEGKRLELTAERDCMGQLELSFEGELSVDMVSLFPRRVWGAEEEQTSATAHANYTGNPNYRLRRDLVEAMRDLHPSFLRFPGGCISEGSYIWDNVYDWKDSVGPVEARRENYNVWGYMMTLGLGYMEYFQLAEDLNAVPLPVMACGVLCQARSDYANPAGGALQEKYIRNFTDLIDFAVNTDFEHNEWAALRRSMGHPAPFQLHYLGVGNENWGEEFYASFEEFYERITAYMKKNYPGYELHIISTVGAQADDLAYQNGWRYLSGRMPGGATVRFTDGSSSFSKDVEWYRYQKDFMETIADEHYYRSNEYLLENADRYNYYMRAYRPDGAVNDAGTSKVFVGEYASTDKNTLAGAVAEAAVMTGFERNSDVVRLAATAPLFNKVLTDGSYRWTPDCIWFDDETVWRTPNYYVQQMFAGNIGKKLLNTSFSTWRDGQKYSLEPSGGVELLTGNADILIKHLCVSANCGGSVLFEQDFAQGLPQECLLWPGTRTEQEEQGVLLCAGEEQTGLYFPGSFADCTVTAVLERRSGEDGFIVGVGADGPGADGNAVRYVIGQDGKTAVRVIKDGVEGYMLGDFSSGTAAGNLRAAVDENLQNGVEYKIEIIYGGIFAKPGMKFADETAGRTLRSGCYAAEGYGAYPHLICSHRARGQKSYSFDYKLEAYNRFVFHSVTRGGNRIYAKLVNADSYAKRVRLELEGLDTAAQLPKQAEWSCLTAPEELVNVPNVNRRGAEAVVPEKRQLEIQNGAVSVELPAFSVSVIAI